LSAGINLNESQVDAVLADENVLCCACPGSGKTRVLVEKVKHILDTTAEPLIVLITYSRDAANELLDRIKKEIRFEQLDSLVIGTFHSIALRQLKRARKAGRIVNQAETNHYLYRAIRHANLDIDLEKAEELINACKLDPAFGESDPAIFALYQAYTSFMRRDNAMDFTDMLLRSVELIRSGDVTEHIDPIPATHILVDEFQDIDRLQLEWLKCHMTDGAIVCAVGDDDQAIYGFRRSLGYQGMMEFAEIAGARTITLNVNYRSTAPILEYAARLIGRNLDRVQKDLMSARGPGREPQLVVCGKREDQYDDVVAKIIAVCSQNPKPRARADSDAPSKYLYTVRKGQIAILARTNFNLLPIETELIKAQVPCFRMGRKPIWAENVVQVFTSLLTSLHNRESVGIELAFRWWGITDTVVEDIRQRVGNLFNFIDPAHTQMRPVEEYGKAIAEFALRASGWVRTLTNADDANEAAQGVIYGVSAWMISAVEAKNEKTKKKDGRSVNLIESALELLDLVRGDIPQRLMRAKSEDDPNLPRVVLSTFHSSKGLEWDHVFLVDCKQGLVPSSEAEEVKELLEEERRLFYVAMTRARDRLVVYTDERQVSEFIHDAGFVLPEKNKKNQISGDQQSLIASVAT
jgi:superfamily I DNA/RNA helicase